MAGPCADWPIDPACNYGIPDNPASRSAVQAFAVKVASEWLWLLTAGIYGTCPRKIRPCGRRCVGFDYYPSQLVDGTWVNITCTCDSSPCGCCYVCEIELDGPVDSVTEIKIGGVVVNSSTYRIDDGFKLVRVGNNPCWPSCQNLSAADTETNTFSVTYQQGLAVPTMGKRALGALAAEIVKSCAGSACRLLRCGRALRGGLRGVGLRGRGLRGRRLRRRRFSRRRGSTRFSRAARRARGIRMHRHSSPTRQAHRGRPHGRPRCPNQQDQAVNRGNAVRPAYTAASPSSSSILSN